MTFGEPRRNIKPKKVLGVGRLATLKITNRRIENATFNITLFSKYH